MKLTIGEKIALLRKERNITQTEMAEYLFLAPQTVSRWEVGSGAPEITLLPKIATFFGVSIDELFGLTSLERTEDLVSKYSVLRDDHSFQEAMEAINSQLQTIDAFLKNGGEDTAGLERDRDQLETEKVHMYIQQGWEALQRALAIVESFVQKTEGNPEHPWYLRMRLQADQLCNSLGRGRETLAERKKDYQEFPSEIFLLRYLSILNHRQDYEMILSIGKADDPAREIIFPPSKKNLSIWRELIYSAAKTGKTDFIEQHLPTVLEVCDKQNEFDFLMCLLDVYDGEKLTAIKQRLHALLPEMTLNKYFEEKVKEKLK